MKKILYILFVLFAAQTFCSCNNEELVDTGVWAGYISFDSSATTKASNLVEGSMAGLDYSVVAFQYANTTTWNVFKATGTPGSSSFPCPTSVTYNDGIWSYDASDTNGGNPLVQWDNNSRYSFFAFYPDESDSRIEMKTDVGTAGVPYVTYSNPTDHDASAFGSTSFVDVMRSSQKDITSSVDGGTVQFTFSHVLSCLTFEARNFDDVASADDHSKDQSVTNLVVYIDSPIYRQMDIPLDETIVPTSKTPLNGTKEYVVNSGTVNVPALVHGTSLTSVPVAPDNNILLVPQRSDGENGHLTGYVSFTDKSDTPRIGKQGVAGYTYDEHLAFDCEKDFEPGKKYALMINFTNGMISIAIIESGDWIDMDQDLIFE